MNLSYILESGTSSQRHLLEHLCFYRVPNFDKPAEFYDYLYKNGVVMDFCSRYDFMELTFFNINNDLLLEIRKAFKSFYFTKEDFELEKRAILIEDINTDKSMFDLHSNSYANIQYPPFDTEYFQSETFENLIDFKAHSNFKEIIFYDKKTLSEDFVFKPFQIKQKIFRTINNKDIVIFVFEKDFRLRDIFIYISYIFCKYDLYIQRHNNIYENSLAFDFEELNSYKNHYQQLILDNIDFALSEFEMIFEGQNSVDWELFDFYNLYNFNKEQKQQWVIDFFDIIYKDIS